ncbi:Holliday junction branch migration DNA helicase RuvB, partial [Candidatus Gracilibacteria bacterium]
RDYSIIGKDLRDKKSIEEIFLDIGIDELGLDYLDKKYLNLILKNFSGGPVGLNTIASSIGEEESTIEDVVEPYLLQIGFIERSPRGRKITGIGIDYLTK